LVPGPKVSLQVACRADSFAITAGVDKPMHAPAQEEPFETPGELRPLLAGNAERAERERLPDENVRTLEVGISSK